MKISRRLKAAEAVGTPPPPPPPGSDTSDSDDNERVKTMQAQTQNDRFRYTGTTNRKPCLQAHVTESRQIVKGKKTAQELLELQTKQLIELLDLSTANFDKVAILRAGYAAPIPPGLVMGNTALGRTRFEDIDNILHRGLAIFEALGKGIGDKREARRKLTKLERLVVQDTTRAENWLIHFNAVFDISGIPESEFKQFLLPACNAMVHANLKDSAVDDFIDTLHTEEKSIGRECTRAEICYIERDKFL